MGIEVTDVLEVRFLDMKNGEVTKVEIEGMDGEFVKAADGSKKSGRKSLFNPEVGEEGPDVEITVDTKDFSGKIHPSVHSFKDGDRVRLLSGGGEHPLIGYKNGKTYQVDSHGTWGGHDPDKLVRIVGGGFVHGYAKPEQLEVVEEEEAVKRKHAGYDCEGTPLYVGDYVVGANSYYTITDDSMLLGKITAVVDNPDFVEEMEIELIAHEDVRVCHANRGDTFEVESNHFRKATALEIAEHL